MRLQKKEVKSMPVIAPKPTISATQQDFRTYLADLRKKSTAQLAGNTYNILVYGNKGIGKTQLLTTCPGTVLVHSFDPGGCKHLGPEIEAGQILYDNRFENEDAKHPTAWNLWESEFRAMRDQNVFDNIDVYCIDSLTTMQQALYNELACSVTRRGTALANDGCLEIKGYNILTQTLSDMIKLCTSLPCNTILTAHVTKKIEEVTGSLFIQLATNPASQIRLPMLFDEFYYMQIDPKDDTKRVLQTANTGRVIAGTRLGRNKFNIYEEPDIGKMMRKAGVIKND